MKKITILVADDHRLIRESWCAILNSDLRLDVIAVATNGEDAIDQAKNRKPDIVLMDINMNPVNGFEATKAIRKYSPGTKIIGVSMHNIPAYARKMLQIGARGYVTKNSPKEELIDAIIEVSRGNKYVCKEVKDILAEENLTNEIMPVGMRELSIREISVIKLIRDGLISKEIATQLNIALKTVEVHRYNILKKLQLSNTASLINFINTQAVV